MQRYNQKDHEWYFVHWYNVLLNSGDLSKLFLAPVRNLTSFLQQFADPNCIAYFDHDARGIWFAGWFRPMGSAVEFSLWGKPRTKHQAVVGYKYLDTLYTNALKTSPVIVGITKQPNLREMHLKLGYHEVGMIPHLLDGEDAHIFAMTPESRADAKVLRYSRLRQIVKGQGMMLQ